MKIKPLILSSLFALSAASGAFAQSATPSVVPKAPDPDEQKTKISVLGQSDMFGAGVAKAGLDKGWALRAEFVHSPSFSEDGAFRAEGQALHKMKGPFVWDIEGSFKSVSREENLISVNFDFPEKEAIAYSGVGMRFAFGRTGIMASAGLQASTANFGMHDGKLIFVRIPPRRYFDEYSYGRNYHRAGVEGSIGLSKYASIEFRADTDKYDNRANLVIHLGKKLSLTGGWDRRFGTGAGGRFSF